MSKENKTIYTCPDNADRTFVCFGSGSIVIGRAEDDIGQQMIWLADTMESHEVGLDSGKWPGEVKGQKVILGFNKPESIDVLVEALLQAKAHLLPKAAGPEPEKQRNTHAPYAQHSADECDDPACSHY